jgi:hypothetical protein
MQPWLAWFGTATVPRFSAWDAVELAAVVALAIGLVALWRRARRPAPPPREEGLPLVVVAAAVAAVLDEPHRIVGITEVSGNSRPASLWSLEGRRSLFASHTLR